MDKTQKVKKLRDRAKMTRNPKHKLKLYYKVGRILEKGYMVKDIRKGTRLGCRRTYNYYRQHKDQRWRGPSMKDFETMSQQRFLFLLKGQEEVEGGTLLETTFTTVEGSRDDHEDQGEDIVNLITPMDERHLMEVTDSYHKDYQWEMEISADDFLNDDWFNDSYQMSRSNEYLQRTVSGP
jgi:hypothetical protein